MANANGNGATNYGIFALSRARIDKVYIHKDGHAAYIDLKGAGAGEYNVKVEFGENSNGDRQAVEKLRVALDQFQDVSIQAHVHGTVYRRTRENGLPQNDQSLKLSHLTVEVLE
jgi:hypothetical protein